MSRCYVLQSMSPLSQRAYWRSTGENFIITGAHLAFENHKVGKYGNCERCGYRPKAKS